MSTGQLIVTIALVGLLVALHLVLRAAREPAGAGSVVQPRLATRRVPLLALLGLAALAALAAAGVAYVVSVVDDDDASAPRPTTTTTAPGATAAPPPPQPPPPSSESLRPPAGTALVARVVVAPGGSLTAGGARSGGRPTVAELEEGVYEVRVAGLTPQLRRRASLRVRPARGAANVRLSARKMGPDAQFVVFTRDARTGALAGNGFDLAVFLPEQDVEGAAGDDDRRPQLPQTR